MCKLERFSGVRVLTFALMSTHYHIVCKVPEPVELSDAELLDRIEALYGPARRDAIARQLHYWAGEAGTPEQAQKIREQFVRRMFDLSIFNKVLKGGFTQWYNRQNRRFGSLWAERFPIVLVQGGQALAAIAAYVDLNRFEPVCVLIPETTVTAATLRLLPSRRLPDVPESELPGGF